MMSIERVATSRTAHTLVAQSLPVASVDTSIGDLTVAVGVVETGRRIDVADVDSPLGGSSRGPGPTEHAVHDQFVLTPAVMQQGGRLSLPQGIARDLPRGSWVGQHRRAAVLLQPATSSVPSTQARTDDRGRLLLGAGLRGIAGYQTGEQLVLGVRRDGLSGTHQILIAPLRTIFAHWAYTTARAEESR